ncbi:MAG: mannitol dehydrogenase [Ruminococcaceae bacterium]|nr:mannitol dehydrogenase [Oscillospiraceae bacterium]
MMSCVIFGAGKISRGFIGHLLYLSGIDFTFVEKFDSLVELINERKEYTVNILGNQDKNCVVKNAKALGFSDKEAISKAIAEADAVFDAVGGKNLGEIVPFLTAGIEEKAKRGGYLNIVTCENWKQPANILKEGIAESISEDAREYFENNVGITEAVIMRSAIESDKELLAIDPLVVNVQDYWELPVDSSRLKGDLPAIKGLKLISEFTGFLERKFYTYNAANGTTSYVGALLGYEKIADAAHDERILKILDGVYMETAQALSLKHNFPLEEQLAFTLTSKKKLQDYTIVDFIERNARDPLRKLGPDDRLVGSARLVDSYGIKPENLSIAIASAIYYKNENDEFANELGRMRREHGVDYILENVCKIDPQGNIAKLVKEKIDMLKKEGYINE